MADIEIEIVDQVATLTMNRPEAMNALSEEMFGIFLSELPKLALDKAVNVLVLRGAGRAFCAGGDIKAMKGNASELGYEERVERLRTKHDILFMLHTMPKPVISVIHGAAAGAGMGLALAADIRIAGPNASFLTSFSRVGFSGDFGLNYLLPRLVGEARSLELFLTSEKIGAERAAELGLVSHLADDDEAMEHEVARLARQFAEGPGLAYAQIKRNAVDTRGLALRDVLDIEAFTQIRMTGTKDHSEAVAAFREKRKPVFGRH